MTWQRRAVFVLALLGTFGCSTGPDPSIAPGEAPPGMVWIPGGRFLMGSDGPHALPNERPLHVVVVDGFFMDRDVVTNAEFAAFVNATGYVTLAERAPDVAASAVASDQILGFNFPEPSCFAVTDLGNDFSVVLLEAVKRNFVTHFDFRKYLYTAMQHGIEVWF